MAGLTPLSRRIQVLLEFSRIERSCLVAPYWVISSSTARLKSLRWNTKSRCTSKGPPTWRVVTELEGSVHNILTIIYKLVLKTLR